MRSYKAISLKIRQAFTIVEALIAVGIIAILVAIAIPTVIVNAKNTSQMKLDATAKQIYIAAQNQITEMQSTGVWKKLREDADIDKGPLLDTQPSDFEYWLERSDIAADQKAQNSWIRQKAGMHVLSGKNRTEGSVLSSILPRYSIDEEILNGGQYYIEYNAETGTIYGVFYTDSAIGFDYVEDVIGGMNNGGRENEDVTEGNALKFRRDYKKDGKGLQIGYYGGGISFTVSTQKLQKIQATVWNGEDLVLTVTDPNSNASEEHTCIHLEVKGQDSGKTVVVEPAVSSGRDYSKVHTDSGTQPKYNLTVEKTAEKREYTFLLDRIGYVAGNKYTNEENLHFASQFVGLYPGENVTIKVICSATDVLALPVTAQVTTNGLFRWVDRDTAEISQVRHLENLDPQISGVQKVKKDSARDTEGFLIKKARVINDLSWNDSGILLADVIHKDYSNLMVTTYDSKDFLDTFIAGSFIPVTNARLEEFDGNGNRLFNAKIDSVGRDGHYARAENIGIFGSYSGVIKNFGVVNYTDGEDIYARYNVCADNIGGLVGSLTNGKLINCCVNVKIRSLSDAASTVDVNLGALAGQVKSSTIENCYAGGFTDNGKYDISEPNIGH